MSNDEKYTITQNKAPFTINYELVITNGDDSYLVDPVGGVRLSRSMRGVPAKLTFGVLSDDVLNFKEGNRVQFKVNGELVFLGFVFEKERNKKGVIKVLCYDQLRYFKYKDCLVYSAKTAGELLKMICDDYGFNMGDIANTVYRTPDTPQRLEHDKSLIDMINYILDQTLINTPNHDMYHLYDDGGKIVLASNEQMKLDVYIDGETLEDFHHTTSIDKDAYNMVKVMRQVPDGERKKLVKTGIVTDDEHIKEWGRLQYLLLPSDKQINAVERAKRILEIKNRKTREIQLRNVLGDIRVRGGSILFVSLNLGDVTLNNYVMVQSVDHVFREGLHMMDLDLFYSEKTGQYEVQYDNDTETYKQIQNAQNTRYTGVNDTMVNSGQVDTAFSANDGRISPYGGVGCVDTVTATGAYYSADLKAEYDAGTVNVDALCNNLQAKGHVVEPFNGYANKGDILVYGNRDHVVISDGVGGAFGNSSSSGHAMRYSDANYAWGNGEPPTEIIRM